METSLEHYPFTGLPNTRDLGGIPTASGKHVRSGLLLRSTALDRATPHDRDLLLNTWNLRTVVDFRNPLEQQQEPYDRALYPGVRFVDNSALALAAVGVSHEQVTGFRKALAAFKVLLHPSQLMMGVYQSLLKDEAGRTAYRRFFQVLLEQEEGAVLWHCTMGKDRAGTATALLLYSLGVSRADIFKNYLATNDYLARFGQAENEKTLAVYHLPHFMMWAVKVVNSVKSEYLETAFASAEEEYGSLDAFLEQALGVGPDERAVLQQKYVE